jgi:hypothetical protein
MCQVVGFAIVAVLKLHPELTFPALMSCHKTGTFASTTNCAFKMDATLYVAMCICHISLVWLSIPLRSNGNEQG